LYVERHFNYIHITFEASEGVEYTIIIRCTQEDGRIKVFVEQERMHLGNKLYIFEPGSGRSEILPLKGPEPFEIHFVSESEMEKLVRERGIDRKKCLNEALEKANEMVS